MPIRFFCDCGQQLAVREENAGRQVRCTACNAVLTAPEGQPAHDAAPEGVDSSMLRFTCPECGKAIQTRAEYAGKRTRCPGCETVVSIPRSSAEPSAVAPRFEKPAPWRADSGGSRLREEDFADEDRLRRRLRKKPANGDAKLWVILGCLLLLVGAAFAGWKLFLQGDSFDGPTDPLDFVPRDALAFGAVDYGKIIRSDRGKQELEKVKQQDPGNLRMFEEQTGLALENLEQITLVALDARGERFWAVVQTNKDYDRKKLIRNSRLRESKHEGKSYYVEDSIGFLFVNSRTMVIGSVAGIQRCLELPKQPAPGPLDEAVKRAASGKCQMVFAGTGAAVKAVADLAAQGQARGFQSAFEQARLISLTSDDASKFAMDLTAEFSDKAKATAAKAEIDDLVSRAKGFLLLGGLALGPIKDQFPGVDFNLVFGVLSKLLDSVKIVQEEAKVSATLSLSQAETEKLMKEIDKINDNQPVPMRPRRR